MINKYLIIALAAILISCNDNTNNQKASSTSKVNKTENVASDILWKPYNRIIGLLSVKFNINDSVVKGIVIDYLRVNQPVDYSVLTMSWAVKDTTVFQNILKPKESIIETLDRFSENYKIGKDSLSLLLYDFELWYNSNKSK